MTGQPKHNRRDRYKGTHPKLFREKYKELQPENYAGDIAKVIQQGRTPAGMHRSICVEEIMTFLKLSPGQTGLDATLGYGGHSLEILKNILPGGKLYAIDVDNYELGRTKERLASFGYGPDVLIIKQMNFSRIDEVLLESGPLHFVLADLGASSMQIDNPERGFSFKLDGPLDLRLDQKNGEPASELLSTISVKELEELFLINSDEPYSQLIAYSVKKNISKGIVISTTTQLRDIITEVLQSVSMEITKEEIKKSCQRCFQALRIAVNNEFEVLDKFLYKLPEILKPGGRIAILSFHSGEDRRVKKWFQHFHREGVYSEVSSSPVRPSAEECNSNPRAKSAKLRWAIKSDE